MKIKQSIIIIFILINTLNAGVINIAVAANVSYAIKDMIKKFNETYPDTKVHVTLGSSGKLTAQINYGAPYEIFMSANMKYPEALYEKSLATTKPLVYAEGTLAYLSLKKRDFTQGMKLLEQTNIKKIAIANPKTAPYGIASLEAVKNAGVYKNIVKKFVYGESISQTLYYTVKATDIGLIATSALYSPKMSRYKKGVNWSKVDTKLYTPIKQGIVILKNAKSKNEVSAFYNFVLSSEGKKILKDYGYIVYE